MTEVITISGLALKIYLNKYYNNNIPKIDKPSVYRDIKQAYYGGITEVYRPYGENLYYYDVNSLYPFASLNDMPGLLCEKLTFYNNTADLSNLFGFFYCKVETPKDLYLGLLPIKTKFGLELPCGTWYGWYFNEELKFAQENGYKITVLNGYSFNRVSNVFTDYINNIYSIKSNPKNSSQKAITKSLLNNLLGRFGINLEKPITDVLSKNNFETKSIMHKIMSYKNISDNKVLVSYVPKLDSDIIESHNLDYIKIANKYKDNEVQNINYTSIPISTAITAYDRIHLNRLKLDIINRGGQVYYPDTDSIVTNIQLPDNMVSNKKLGKLKLEHKIDKAIFISGKIYCFLDKKRKFY